MLDEKASFPVFIALKVLHISEPLFYSRTTHPSQIFLQRHCLQDPQMSGQCRTEILHWGGEGGCKTGKSCLLPVVDTTSHCSKMSSTEWGIEGRRNGSADERGNKGAGLTSIGGIQIPWTHKAGWTWGPPVITIWGRQRAKWPARLTETVEP